MGYRAGPGYDQVTGLGSVDAYTLALSWRAAISKTALLTITQFTASTSARSGLVQYFAARRQHGRSRRRRLCKSEYSSRPTEHRPQRTISQCSVTRKDWRPAQPSRAREPSILRSITPGVYLLLGIADFNQSILKLTGRGTPLSPSTGPLTVTR